MTVNTARQANHKPLIVFKGVTKVYGHGQAAVQALRGVTFTIEAGEFIAVMGPRQRLGPDHIAGAAPFVLRDARAIAEEIGGLRAVAPVSSKGLTAIYGNENWSTSVTGTTNAYFKAGNWTIARGRSFTDGELRSGAAVCIFGDNVHRELFGMQDPLDNQIRLQKLACQAVGLLASKGQSALGRD